jgi:predicted homoserine dehydrogenase-like protein
LAKVLIPEADGGVLSKAGCVDYSVGKGVAPGIFVIVKAPHPRIAERLTDLKMGPGPYYSFLRPYHLTSLEVPLTCARIALYGKADMQPLDRPVAEVCAVAKKDLQPGDQLDAIGEYTYRSWTMTAEDARKAGAIPCGLLEGGAITAPIAKGEMITYTNAKPNPAARIVALRAKQDAMFS